MMMPSLWSTVTWAMAAVETMTCPVLTMPFQTSLFLPMARWYTLSLSFYFYRYHDRANFVWTVCSAFSLVFSLTFLMGFSLFSAIVFNCRLMTSPPSSMLWYLLSWVAVEREFTHFLSQILICQVLWSFFSLIKYFLYFLIECCFWVSTYTSWNYAAYSLLIRTS